MVARMVEVMMIKRKNQHELERQRANIKYYCALDEQGCRREFPSQTHAAITARCSCSRSLGDPTTKRAGSISRSNTVTLLGPAILLPDLRPDDRPRRRGVSEAERGALVKDARPPAPERCGREQPALVRSSLYTHLGPQACRAVCERHSQQ